MLEYEIGSAVISLARAVAWIYFGDLLYRTLPTRWPKLVKLPIAIVTPFGGLVAISILLGID